MFLADAVGRKLLVIPFADFFSVRAGEDFNDMIQADAEVLFLPDAIDAGEKFLRGESAIKRGARGKAIVARATIRASVGSDLLVSLGRARRSIGATIILPKIRQQFLAPAAGALGVVDHLLQLRAGDLLLLQGWVFRQ